MYNVNVLGLVVNTIYLLGFIYYTPEKLRGSIYTTLAKSAGFAVLVLAYASIENKDVIEFRFGMIITGILLLLVGLPLLEIPEIIKKQCTEGMPFPIILSGFAVSAAWMLYGFATRNPVFVVSIYINLSKTLKLNNVDSLQMQNGILTVITGFQLSLFAMYPNTPSSADKLKKKKKN